MASILCIALNPSIDLFNETSQVVPTKKVRVRNQHQNMGGGGVNVARALVELGERPGLLVMSGGATGALLIDAIRPLSLDLHVIPIEGSTRIAFMVKETETGKEYRFVPEGPLVSEQEFGDVVRFLERETFDYVIVSGSLPRGLQADSYTRLARILAGKGSHLVLDASGAALKEALQVGGLFMIKPSLDELEDIVGRSLDEESAVAAAQDLVERGCVRYVCISMAHQGALLVSPEGIMRAPSFPVPVGSTVGAGDSFVAAMVWALARSYRLEDALRFAVAAGAATVTRGGGELFRREDAFALYQSGPPALPGG